MQMYWYCVAWVYITKGPLYIRMARVPYIRWLNPESVFTKGYLWSKYGGPKKMTKIG